MDNLIAIYNKAENDKVSPLICAAWFHQAFTMIHPFQDGNGRVARLLASLILIKHRLFPFAVPREEAKSRYIDALEKADTDQPQTLVAYFAATQKRHIEKALNFREGSGVSFDEVAGFLSGKIEKWQEKKVAEREEQLDPARMRVFNFCLEHLNLMAGQLRSRLNGNAILSIQSCPQNEQEKQGYYGQIIKYAKQHNYYFNRNFPKGWLTLRIELANDKIYQLCITVHHYGYDDSTLAIGGFLEFLTAHSNKGVDEERGDNRTDEALPLEIKPHIISITDDVTFKEKNILGFIQGALTQTMAQIASEL